MAEKTIPSFESQPGGKHSETRQRERFAVPPVDIHDTPNGLKVIADLPGVAREDLDIRVEEGVLTIQAQARLEEIGESLRQEFAPGAYHRSFQLNDRVDVDKIEAELKNGVLTLSLPKPEAPKPRRVEVKVA